MTTNSELHKRQAAAVARGVATRGVYAARAENALIFDVEGRSATSTSQRASR